MLIYYESLHCLVHELLSVQPWLQGYCYIAKCIHIPFPIIYIILQEQKIYIKNEQRSRDAAAKKRANTSGIGKSNDYYEDIYIPPYNNSH